MMILVVGFIGAGPPCDALGVPVGRWPTTMTTEQGNGDLKQASTMIFDELNHNLYN